MGGGNEPSYENIVKNTRSDSTPTYMAEFHNYGFKT